MCIFAHLMRKVERRMPYLASENATYQVVVHAVWSRYLSSRICWLCPIVESGHSAFKLTLMSFALVKHECTVERFRDQVFHRGQESRGHIALIYFAKKQFSR
jgi:hypothetical protein